jgi:hypothetical protein
MNAFSFSAIAWSPEHHDLLASGCGTADHCIPFWNTHTGQRVQHVDTGSPISNLPWSRDSSELVSFLHIIIVPSSVIEISEVRL